MKKQLKFFRDYKNWESLVINFPASNIFQTETYYQFLKRNYGWCEKYHLVYKEGDETLAVALAIFKKRYSFLPSFLGTPEIFFGPLIKGSSGKIEDDKILSLIVDKFDDLCQRRGFSSSVIIPAPNSAASSLFKSNLTKDTQKDPYCTFLIDLRNDERELFSSLSSSWRRYVNWGYRNLDLIEVKDPGDPLIDEIYQIHKEKVKRLQKKGVKIEFMPLAYFRNTVDIFVKRGLARYLVGLYKREVVSSDCTLGFGDFGYSWLADTSRKYPKLKASHVLRWEGILWSKKQGYKYYDFGQVAPGPFEKIPKEAQGVYIFKQRFGGDYSATNRRYKTYSSLGKKVFDLLLKPYLYFLDIKHRF